jgi:hypothetical protein
MNADTTLAAGSTFTADLDGTVPGTSHDQIVEKGVIHLNNAVLDLVVGYTPSPSDRYVLVDNQGASPIDGTFSGYTNHAIINVGGEYFRIFYDGGDGNDVVLVKTAPLAVSTIVYEASETDPAATQRSVISRVVVTFNGLLDSLDPTGALRVDHHANGGVFTPLSVSYTQEQVGEATQLILTYENSGIYTYDRSGEYSLNDGNYRLTVDHTKVGTAIPGGGMSADELDEFYRFFGDSDADRDTDGNDMFNIRRVMAGDASYSQYEQTFDYNGDGVVDGLDYSPNFRNRYGRRLLPPT